MWHLIQFIWTYVTCMAVGAFMLHKYDRYQNRKQYEQRIERMQRDLRRFKSDREGR